MKKYNYTFEMAKKDCYDCPFLRAEAFGNHYFCKAQDYKRRVISTDELIQGCTLTEVE